MKREPVISKKGAKGMQPLAAFASNSLNPWAVLPLRHAPGLQATKKQQCLHTGEN